MRFQIAVILAFFTTTAMAQDAAEPPSQLADLLGSDAADEFARALEPREFSFPADHGPHPAFRNEWWYVTGNLDGENGQRFGFELTFFRFSLTPTAEPSDSAWRTNQVYIAHLALTDAEDERFLVAQRYSRGALGLAGARAEPFRVHIDDWQIEVSPTGEWHLVAQDDEFGIDVTLLAERDPVLNGVNGLSQKSSLPGNASYYYSITRLATNGQVRIGERQFRVSGLSWFDREWSTSALADDQVGWDWFALQLSDGSDLMFYNLRRKDGTQDGTSGGTLTRADGTVQHLGPDDLMIEVLDTWDSPDGGSYPSRWRLSLPAEDLDLKVTPVISNQELFTTVRYWEGAVDAAGQQDNRSISGRGYVELTGYAE
jgi:predicted secreted hydrolase